MSLVSAIVNVWHNRGLEAIYDSPKMIPFEQFREGLRIGLRGISSHWTKPIRFDGDAMAICRQIVEQCWDAKNGYFRTSFYNYPEFYARDFGMCVDALVKLGYREQVIKTLQYALRAYKEHGYVTQIITPRHHPIHFLGLESPDALAFLLHALQSADSGKLIEEYCDLLAREIKRICAKLIREDGLIKRELYLSGMRDYAIRQSSCYDNTMIAAIKNSADALGISHPLGNVDYPTLLLEHFWTGAYFQDDLENDAMTGDANVAPLWFRIFLREQEGTLLDQILPSIRVHQLDVPVVLRFEHHAPSHVRMHWLDWFVSWQHDTAWLHLGNMFLQVLARHDKALAQRYLVGHTALIEREHCYPELVRPDGKPFRTFFFSADGTMLWAANYLALRKELAE